MSQAIGTLLLDRAGMQRTATGQHHPKHREF
jgi:hypothetical protein